MPVNTNFDGERNIAANFDEGRAEILVVKMKRVVIYKYRLARIIKTHIAFFLSDTDKYNPAFHRVFTAHLSCNVIFALSMFKMDDGNVVFFGILFDVLNEILCHLT